MRRTPEEAKTEHAMAREELEDICIDKWVEHSKENGSPSGTITLHTRGEDATEVRVIPTTRFTKMDESTANYLRENGYADLIVEETSYSLNPKILSKYMKEISDAIQRCKKIPQEDKDRLFKATTKYKVNNKMCGDKRFSLKRKPFKTLDESLCLNALRKRKPKKNINLSYTFT